MQLKSLRPTTALSLALLFLSTKLKKSDSLSPAAILAAGCNATVIYVAVDFLCRRNVILTISITIFALANIIVCKLREIWEDSTCTEEEIKPSARAERFCRRFTLAEIQLATKSFSYDLIIGKGGFGNVYKGLIDNGKEIVAVKRLKFDSRQGAHEFLTEIETLSELRHHNLVSLIGYCNEQREMILVYEYMAGGTLGDHLYKLARKGNSCASLTWKQRLNICIGAGRGLDYLHTGHGVIHRDVKTSNILLDENFTPKVSDFGLVKHENLNNLQSHVSTKVKGTFGYLDPVYSSSGKLTRKSDTYAFGVVLLEVLCGRPANDQRVSEAEQILTKWAQRKIREGEAELIVASNLKKEISPNSLNAFVEVVKKCLDDEPKKRPTMAQVVLQLEFALEQQDILEPSVPKVIMIDAPSSDEANLSAGEQATTALSIDDITLKSSKVVYSRVVYAGWMVRYGRKIGGSFMRYFVLESRILVYYMKPPQDNRAPMKTLLIDRNCRVEDLGLKKLHGHMVYVLYVFNKKKRDKIVMAAFNVEEALIWKQKIESVIDQHQESRTGY